MTSSSPDSSNEKKENKPRDYGSYAGAVVIVLGLLFFLNPGYHRHREAVKAKLMAAMAENRLATIADQLSLGIVSSSMEEQIDKVPLYYDNYYLFSTTSSEQGRKVSTGILGMVWVKTE